MTLNPFSAEIIEILTFLVHISKTVADRTTVVATNPHRVDPAEFNGAIFRPLGSPKWGFLTPKFRILTISRNSVSEILLNCWRMWTMMPGSRDSILKVTFNVTGQGQT